MDFLNRFYTQLVELTRAMTPRARIAAAVAITIVVLGLGYVGRREFSADHVYLLGGQELSASELTAMQGALGKAKLNDFVVEGNRIRVPRAKQADYLAALADGNALPQTSTDVFAEVTEKTTWFTSRPQQLDQARTAKKKALALMLRGMHGVESAEVDFDKEEPRGLRRDHIATAFVALKLKAGHALDESRAAFFQRTVAAALGMAPHDVTVADKVNLLIFGGRGATGPADDVYRDLKRKYQTDYEETVRKALMYVPGITVSADVELDRELRREERRIDFDANQPANLGKVSRTPSVAVDDAAAPHSQTKIEMAGLTPKRVSISVGVPVSYFETVWRQRHPTAPLNERSVAPVAELAQLQSEEIARIKQHVAGLIPTADHATAGPAVTVTPFSTVQEPEMPAPTIPTLIVEWLAVRWTQVATVIAIFIGLLMLRSTLRSAVDSSTKRAENPVSPLLDKGASGANPSARFRAAMAERGATGKSMRDEVADLVREDPAAAASVLRSWIGNAN